MIRVCVTLVRKEYAFSFLGLDTDDLEEAKEIIRNAVYGDDPEKEPYADYSHGSMRWIPESFHSIYDVDSEIRLDS